MRSLILFMASLCLCLKAHAFSAGPPFAHTGAPGEANCTACHSSFPLNSGNGSFVIEGPVSFRANESHTITVRLQDPGQSRWGFELTTLGQGGISLLDIARTQVDLAPNGYQYLRHTRSGSDAGTPNGPVSWTFTWTAPASPPNEMSFWAAGNAANNNLNSNGDDIYTTSLTVPLALDPVDDLAIVAVGTAAQLSWSAVPTASHYRVERSGGLGGTWQELATVAAPGHTDPVPPALSLYRVVALR